MRSKLVCLVAGLALAGCHPKAKEITPLQRKEAASLVSEAQFAMTLKDYARAEELYTKAANLSPDTADYWISLGAARKNLGRIPDAKKAYESGLKAHESAYAQTKDPQNLLEQMYLLGLLGRLDDARAMLKKAQAAFPDDPRIRSLSEKGLEQLMVNPDFKAMAL